MKYVIGSGWWCAPPEEDERELLIGDDVIRGSDFHKLWYKSVCEYTDPEKILIVDSCSPIKPPINMDDDRVELVRLNINAGHNTNHKGKYCGCVRAMEIGLLYTLMCEADYYVYVEQDALLYGSGIIEHCVSKMKKPIMFGSGSNTPCRTQQSFFIVRKDAIWGFLKSLNSIPYTDSQINPEEKFHIACSLVPSIIQSWVYMHSSNNSFLKWVDWQFFKFFRGWQVLPVDYGRVRPLDMKRPFFYFQHGGRVEIDEYLELTGFEWNG
ncbi:hypothetical protein KOI40_13760 [Aestuariicella sp. G3-2]|uniref:hypothetical protein n=1 Tax=Pseudomaricurvus albidus TaxID=2842452 RepID=UPI001C0CEA40|nr:hypothetical protein [Aestuariicella albida]MBU3070888.1 hypothetical protein [Aestuariicella albida]